VAQYQKKSKAMPQCRVAQTLPYQSPNTAKVPVPLPLLENESENATPQEKKAFFSFIL